MTTDQYNTLKKHHDLWVLFRDHNYMPQSSHKAVVEISQVYTELFNNVINMQCRDCIADMMRSVYRVYRLHEEYQNKTSAPLEDKTKSTATSKITTSNRKKK